MKLLNEFSLYLYTDTLIFSNISGSHLTLITWNVIRPCPTISLNRVFTASSSIPPMIKLSSLPHLNLIFTSLFTPHATLLCYIVHPKNLMAPPRAHHRWSITSLSPGLASSTSFPWLQSLVLIRDFHLSPRPIYSRYEHNIYKDKKSPLSALIYLPCIIIVYLLQQLLLKAHHLRISYYALMKSKRATAKKFVSVSRTTVLLFFRAGASIP